MGDETVDKMIITLSNYTTFFGIATRSLSQIRDLVRELNLRRKSRERMTRADVDFECLKNEKFSVLL